MTGSKSRNQNIKHGSIERNDSSSINVSNLFQTQNDMLMLNSIMENNTSYNLNIND